MATIVEPSSDFSALPPLPADVYTAPLQRPAHVGEDWLEPRQREYSSDDDAIWNALFERQMEILPGRACGAFMAGLQKLHLNRGGVPEFGRLSEELGALTGWSVVPVPMLIPDHVFFWHLANRRLQHRRRPNSHHHSGVSVADAASRRVPRQSPGTPPGRRTASSPDSAAAAASTADLIRPDPARGASSAAGSADSLRSRGGVELSRQFVGP